MGAIPALYGAAGSAWFAVTGFAGNVNPVETQKDVAFVLISAVSIWLLQRWALRKLMSSQLENIRASRRAYQEKGRLHDILMKLPVVLIATNEAGEYVFWNYEAERLLGYSEKEMLHRPGAAQLLRVDPEYDLRMRRAFQESTGDARGWEWKLRAKDGSVRNMIFFNISRSAPVPDWHSWAVGVDSAGKETVENRLRGLLDHLPIACLRTDSSGSFQYMNPAAERLLGYPSSQMQGKHAGQVIAAGPQKIEIPDIASRAAPVVLAARASNGNTLQCRWRCVPLENAETAGGFLAMVEDITELTQARQAAVTSSQNLEKRVLKINAELTAAKETVDAYANIMSQGRADASITRDLLKLLQLLQREPQIRSIDLTSMARDVGRELMAHEAGRSIELNVEPNLRCQGDPELIRMLLENLLSNALKFTRPRATTLIEIGRLENGFFVRDNGIGFDIRLSHMLFRPFQKLHNDSTFPGSGLGLTAVKRIVLKHDGSVQGNGVPGGGATFTFSIGAPAATQRITVPAS